MEEKINDFSDDDDEDDSEDSKDNIIIPDINFSDEQNVWLIIVLLTVLYLIEIIRTIPMYSYSIVLSNKLNWDNLIKYFVFSKMYQVLWSIALIYLKI